MRYGIFQDKFYFGLRITLSVRPVMEYGYSDIITMKTGTQICLRAGSHCMEFLLQNFEYRRSISIGRRLPVELKDGVRLQSDPEIFMFNVGVRIKSDSDIRMLYVGVRVKSDTDLHVIES